VKQGDPVYATDVPICHIFLRLEQSNVFYIGKMKELPDYKKYEVFIE
jgi:hypothetical protein